MNEIPDSLEFNGLLSYPNLAAPGGYCFVPLTADVERDSRGHPMCTLLGVGSGGYVVLTAVWRADDEAVESLRLELARRDGVHPSTIRLSPASATVARCQLLLGDGSGTFQVIAASATSGTAPYSAVLSVRLDADRFPGAVAALRGQAGFLAVQYEVAIDAPITVRATLKAGSPELMPRLSEYYSVGEAGLCGAIQEAVDDDLAVVRVDVSHDPTGRVTAALYERAVARAASVLPGWLDHARERDAAGFQVSVSLRETMRQRIRPILDLSALHGAAHLYGVEDASASRDEREAAVEASRRVRVATGLHDPDAPVAWMRVRSGGSEVILTAPAFAPADLVVGPDDAELSVSVGYSNGAGVHKRTVPVPRADELVLTPEMLGLAVVEIDASPLALAGARSAQIWLRYAPIHGSEQRYTIRFQPRSWSAQWWLATADERRPPSVEYTWSAVNADGQVAYHSPAESDWSTITLSLTEQGAQYAAD